MLPSLTSRALRRPGRRALLGTLVTLLLSAAALSARPDDPVDARPSDGLADRLAPSSWALTVPTGWLAAPITGLRTGDRIDVLALRSGDRASASAIAFDLEVMSIDATGLVLDARAEDATAIAVARAGGLLLVPLLRSTR